MEYQKPGIDGNLQRNSDSLMICKERRYATKISDFRLVTSRIEVGECQKKNSESNFEF